MAIACGGLALGIGVVLDPVLRDLLGTLGYQASERNRSTSPTTALRAGGTATRSRIARPRLSALGIGVVLDPVLRDLLGTLGLSGLEAVLSDLAEGASARAGAR
jgi:hypothetical protein